MKNPSFDEAIVGVDIITGAVIYNYNLMVQCLTKDENMTVDEAIDFIDYNTRRATPYMPEPRPIILNEMIV